jgi:2-polyprenyl-6-methoxyphenol hydroxylase-like FAD-dependent oxidoreductase
LEVRAIFLVGCDGSHGTVRHLLDLPFTGGEYRHHGLHREPGEIADADFGYVGGAPGK